MHPNRHLETCHRIYKNRQALCNTGNSEPWHTDNPGIYKTLTYLKPMYIQNPLKDLRCSFLWKQIKVVIFFHKLLYLGSLKGF